jgi:WD40 repeat protein
LLEHATDLTFGRKFIFAVEEGRGTAEIRDARTGGVITSCGSGEYGSMNVTADGMHFYGVTYGDGDDPGELSLWDGSTCSAAVITDVADYGNVPAYSPRTESYSSSSLLAGDGSSYAESVVLLYGSTDTGPNTRVADLKTGEVGAPLDGRLDSGFLPSDPAAKPTILSQDGRFAAVRDSGEEVRLVNTMSGDRVTELAIPKLIMGDPRFTPTSSRFSPDGSIFAAVSPDGISLVDAGGGQAVGEPIDVDLGDSTVSQGGLVAFSPDSAFISVVEAGGESVMVFDAHSAKLRATLHGHSGPVHAIRYLPDSRTLVTSLADDGTVRIWRLPDR